MPREGVTAEVIPVDMVAMLQVIPVITDPATVAMVLVMTAVMDPAQDPDQDQVPDLTTTATKSSPMDMSRLMARRPAR
jgi:hypothetical protein